MGTTGIELSTIGLGGAWLGHHPDDPVEVQNARDVLAAVEQRGVNWLDTSENYFDTANEQIIGQALRSMPDDFLVCSKVAPSAGHSGGASGFRPQQVRRACEESLRRLGREHLDLYLLHWPDASGVPLADTWAAMAGLADDGLVRSIGLSNYDQQDVERCHRERAVDVTQTGLNVLEHLEERPLITWCGKQQIAVTIYEPLASGAITDTPFTQVRARWAGGPWDEITRLPGLFAPENEASIGRVTAGLRGIADRIGATLAEVGIAWVLAQPGVTSALVGSSDPSRASTNTCAADLRLTDADLQAIEELIQLGPAFTNPIPDLS